MSTDIEKPCVYLPHWIEHNAEYAAESRVWAGRASRARRSSQRPVTWKLLTRHLRGSADLWSDIRSEKHLRVGALFPLVIVGALWEAVTLVRIGGDGFR